MDSRGTLWSKVGRFNVPNGTVLALYRVLCIERRTQRIRARTGPGMKENPHNLYGQLCL